MTFTGSKAALVAIVLALCITASADATTITVTATGSVTDVIAPDIYGTQLSDVITMSATFDSTSVVDVASFAGIAIPGVQFASLAGPDATLSVSMRGQHWSATDEPLFGVNFITPLPHILLVDGHFVGMNFFGIGADHNTFLNDAVGQIYFGDPLGQIFGGNDDPNAPPFWIGQWDLASASVTVPEPGTAMLFAVGIVSLLATGLARPRRVRVLPTRR